MRWTAVTAVYATHLRDSFFIGEGLKDMATEQDWQPIETAPKMRTILLFAVTDVDEHGTVKNWKMATGSWHTGYEDMRSMERGYSPWEWDGVQLRQYSIQPTHWMPLPDPPTETGAK